MDDKVYTISQAAKEVGESTSVLRYWEEVLGIRINRDQKGYRRYTGYDIQLFLNIKELKKRGLKLEAIRDVIPRIYQYGPGAPKSKTKLLEDPGEVEEITYVNEVIDMQGADGVEGAEEICGIGDIQEIEPVREEVCGTGDIQEEEPAGEEVCEMEEIQEEEPAGEEILTGASPVQDVKAPEETRQEDGIQEGAALRMDPMEDLRITEFQSILEKLIAQGVKEKNQEELRIRKLDEKIRFHQQSLKQVAAAQEMKQRRGRGRRRKK